MTQAVIALLALSLLSGCVAACPAPTSEPGNATPPNIPGYAPAYPDMNSLYDPEKN
jgi:hypothetical protein